MTLASDIREIVSFYPFKDMSATTKGYVSRLATRAEDVEEELLLYRQMFEAMNSAGLLGAKRLAKFRHKKEQRSGPDHGEQTMLTVNEKVWRCSDCGSNVLTKISAHQYICNGCQTSYFGFEE